jgi:hypothetical protein
MTYRLPMFPLSTVLFPSGQLALHVFEPRYRQMTTDCLAGSGEFGVVLISRGSEVGGGEQRVSVGTVAAIQQAQPLADGRWVLVASGRRRIRVAEWLPDDPYPLAEVEDLPDDDGWAKPDGASDDEWDSRPMRVVAAADAVSAAATACERARALLSELDRPLPPLVDRPRVDEADVPAWAAASSWWLCAVAPLGPIDSQGLLENTDPVRRMADLTVLMEDTADDLVRLLAGG